MTYYNVRYGPKVGSSRCAASIDGDCSKVKKGTVFQYQNGVEVILDSIAMMHNDKANEKMEVLLKGAINIYDCTLILKE